MSELKNHEARGLTGVEVEERRQAGLINMTKEKTSRSFWEIVRTNVFTRFNALLTVLFVIIMIVGQPIDALFFVAVIINSGIGIIQETRAKRTLDRLTILSAPRVTVIRDEREVVLPSDEIVQDDLVKIKIGDQVPADGMVVLSNGVEIDESLLTGEADPVHKKAGDEVLSGSIVVAGDCAFKATKVGEQAYAHQLTAQVKKFKKAHSELLEGTNKLLGYISIIILIVAPVLIWGQLSRSPSGRFGQALQAQGSPITFQDATTRSIAAIVGMIPEGLVVLTSFAFVLASLTLARRKVLVQELPAVEGLARVDVICLDKTGTLTEGGIAFKHLEMVGNAKEKDIRTVFATFAANPDSPTLDALHEEFPFTTKQPTATVAFSSKRKWSALNFGKEGWIMGAPEIMFPDSNLTVRRIADGYAAEGLRVLVLAHSTGTITDQALPKNMSPEALIILEERVRADAKETLQFFSGQGVTLKIISGDNPRTVAAIASRVGVDASKVFDARELPKDVKTVAKIIETHDVFGRVLPEQKRLFVRALQASGHVVAMTGDGVNDALALKDADMGIAMGNGAPATRAIAKIVLLDNKFSHMPYVLAEGRRVIANIERVANLFVIKNVYNLTFALAVTVLALSFPFLPRHLSLISWLTIGIPSFFLALAPNNQRYIPGFLPRVLRFAVPVGVVVAIAAFYTYFSTLQETILMKPASSAAVISVVTIGFWVLMCLARPWRAWKVGLILTMALFFMLAISWPWLAQILEFRSVWPYNLKGFAVGLVGAGIVELIWRRHEGWRARTLDKRTVV